MTYPGAGVGTLAYALCQYNPRMKITVCDLQPVVSLTHHFRPSVKDCPNQANVSFVVGDFFKSETLPKADLYVLSRILHDWPKKKLKWFLTTSSIVYPQVRQKRLQLPRSTCAADRRIAPCPRARMPFKPTSIYFGYQLFRKTELTEKQEQ